MGCRELLEAIADPKHQRHAEFKECNGDPGDARRGFEAERRGGLERRWVISCPPPPPLWQPPPTREGTHPRRVDGGLIEACASGFPIWAPPCRATPDRCLQLAKQLSSKSTCTGRAVHRYKMSPRSRQSGGSHPPYSDLCETSTSTCRSFTTISSGLYLFLGISVLAVCLNCGSVQRTPLRPASDLCTRFQRQIAKEWNGDSVSDSSL